MDDSSLILSSSAQVWFRANKNSLQSWPGSGDKKSTCRCLRMIWNDFTWTLSPPNDTNEANEANQDNQVKSSWQCLVQFFCDELGWQCHRHWGHIAGSKFGALITGDSTGDSVAQFNDFREWADMARQSGPIVRLQSDFQIYNHAGRLMLPIPQSLCLVGNKLDAIFYQFRQTGECKFHSVSGHRMLFSYCHRYRRTCRDP